ncbi:probable receptor-like protein kinase At1g80640 [Actinidia eriantha]|uniref:probable receptor-like protein kinase At1g80640 n=1 Tax=Actinidia eriantha TaxID=165200 RepID=UPI00258FC40A|nr:probable receptor-like protein kinase At1g80640 [Actinidia eriantha]
MNLLVMLMPIWVFSSIWIWVLAATDAISDPVLPTEKQPSSQISSQMADHSPGVPEVRVVHHQDLNKKILIALVVASSLLGGILLSLLCCWICRRKNLKNPSAKSQHNQDAAKGLSLGPILGRFNSLRMASARKGSAAFIDYQLLVAATNNFQEDNVLGEGGFGRVYKARFNDNLLAAVKRLYGQSQDAEREFEKELDWLSKIHHQNIVSLLGYCIHGEARFLVYEMMHNGSLESQLHGPSHGSSLTWLIRMKIALDVARGLEFLHERCNPPMIHRDLKSSNILLDSNFNAKLSDFGLAVAGGIRSTYNVKLSGTLGYVAPEYLLDGKLTEKSDVYAFGVVLLELLMGRKPVEKVPPAQCQSIVTWAMPQLTDRSKLPNIVDPVIRNTMDLKHLYQVAAVAVLCVQPEPSYRPLITDVLHSFIPLVPLELGGSLRFPEPSSH